jgi:hypothetical protein
LYNLARKQQKNQGRGRRGMNRAARTIQAEAGSKAKQYPPVVEGPLADLGRKSCGTRLFGDPEEYVPKSKPAEDHEGMRLKTEEGPAAWII